MYAANTIRFPFLTSTPATAGSANADRNARDFGVGYGRSSGYARRSYATSTSGFSLFRVA